MQCSVRAMMILFRDKCQQMETKRTTLPSLGGCPKEQWERGLAPMRLLDPSIEVEEIGNWCDCATVTAEESRALERQVTRLQASIREANLPYLELPVETRPDEAIDVFIFMNTSSVRLSAFDIVVAQLEAETGQSLHDLEGSLRSAVPDAVRYVEVPDLVLRVAALREDRPPTESSFTQLDLHRLSEEWEAIERGIDGAVGFLEEERIFDRDRLPTVAVVRCLPRSGVDAPVSGCTWRGPYGTSPVPMASILHRQIRSCGGTAALQDYRGLRTRLVNGDVDAAIPVLDETRFPIAEPGEGEVAATSQMVLQLHEIP